MLNVGIVGAGVMGSGVAQSFAQIGCKVILIDLTNELLEQAKETITQNLRFQAFFKKDAAMEDQTQVLNRVIYTTEYDLLADSDFVVENATEKWEIKKEIYPRLDLICRKEAIFAANTSCVSITKIASLTKRPDKIIGTHFMNPVPLIAAVEVIRGYYTSEETIERTKEILSKMGKEAIVVNDSPGFVSNRISHLLMNEAAFVVQDQVATPGEVDEIFKKCYSHKMGPLETADLIGLDTVVNSLDVLYESFQDPKFRCCPLLRKMVDAGLYGKKSGQGFYNY